MLGRSAGRGPLLLLPLASIVRTGAAGPTICTLVPGAVYALLIQLGSDSMHGPCSPCNAMQSHVGATPRVGAQSHPRPCSKSIGIRTSLISLI